MKNAVIALLVVALAVSLAAGALARSSRTVDVDVEVRVWQDVNEPSAVWLSARPEGGSWADLGTVPVPLDGGVSASGRYRYGDIVVALRVPLAATCADASLAGDCAALLAAKEALTGGEALNWSADVPVAEWDGVTVSGDPLRVTGLDLSERGIGGGIPPELGKLGALEHLDLSGNDLSGTIPPELTNLTELRTLALN